MKRKSLKDFSKPVKKKIIEVTNKDDEGTLVESEDNFSDLLQSLKSNKQIMRRVLLEQDKRMTPWVEEKADESNEDSNYDDDDDEDDDTNEVEIESEEEYAEITDPQNDDREIVTDPFKTHFEKDIPDDVAAILLNTKQFEKMTKKNAFHTVESYELKTDLLNKLEAHVSHLSVSCKTILQNACVKEIVIKNWEQMNKKKMKKGDSFSSLQKEIYSSIGAYKDLFYFNENHQNMDDIKKLYTMHAVNHVLKTRSRIVKNNSTLDQAEKEKRNIEVLTLSFSKLHLVRHWWIKLPHSSDTVILYIIYSYTITDCRDQGLTRPKVLIIVPFKNSCLKIVQHLIRLVFSPGTKGQIMQKKRFMKEFSPEEEEVASKANRPDDFKVTFEGNIDDCFRVGIALSKNTIKLFTPFYSSDIIISSPLGLRTIIGSKGEKQDFDFLSSIEILIADQADIFLMQNWEHVTHIFEHLHKLPKESHNTDFSRVRMWCVNQWSELYRQTLLFSSVQTPELNFILNKHCNNFNGKIKLLPKEIHGSVEQIAHQTPQVFQLVPSTLFSQLADDRFNYFINKVLPDFKGQMFLSTAIFIPSYFDFVRIRNYFKKEELPFVQISEYSKRSNISRARNLFVEKRKHFLLFTERFYFFYRYRMRGIKHIIFYELPQYPTFYSEIINFLESTTDNSTNSVSCTAMYSRFDGFKLEAILGSTRCKQILSSPKDVHMILGDGDGTGEIRYIFFSEIEQFITEEKHWCVMYCEGLSIVRTIQETLNEYEEMLLFFSHFGDPRYSFLILFPLTYCWNVSLGLKVLWTSSAVEWLNAILKWLVRDDRPYWYESSQCSIKVAELKQFPITCETGPGFPSGHVMSISALGMLLLLHMKMHFRSLKHQVIFLLSTLPTLAFIIVLVSISRIYIATHFPHQVIMGAFVGICCAVWINTTFNSFPVEAIFSPVAVLVGISSLITGLLVFYTLMFFNVDPLATVTLAMKYCGSRDWVHLDTTLFFAIIRDAGCLTGLGLASFILTQLIGPKARMILFDNKFHPLFRVMCAVLICLLLFFIEAAHMSQEKVLKFYVMAFLKFSLLPCYVITMKCTFEIFCTWVSTKKCKLK